MEDMSHSNHDKQGEVKVFQLCLLTVGREHGETSPGTSLYYMTVPHLAYFQIQKVIRSNQVTLRSVPGTS